MSFVIQDLVIVENVNIVAQSLIIGKIVERNVKQQTKQIHQFFCSEQL